MNKPDSILKIYTDGACKGNPGVGGWAGFKKFPKKLSPNP